ncbi:MAG: hypothetical protein JO307_02220 [Bryobacterales bacterium]|nr:hypothetical protein [Bryobacterales bacterium]MBV9398700.1 hypothetical protein [Bryobacterales bacterium]
MQKLERECRVFARYLSGVDPSSYLVQKYGDFHEQLGASAGSDRFDEFLVRVASRGVFWTTLADGYSRLFRKSGALRKKLIVVLALLECAPPSYEILDSVPTGGLAGSVVRLAGISAKFLAAAIAGTVLFAPARVWMSARER